MKSQVNCFEKLYFQFEEIANQTRINWKDESGQDFFQIFIQPLENIIQSQIQAMNVLEQRLMEIKQEIDKI